MARPPPRQDPEPGVQPRLLPSHGLSSGESLSSSPLRSTGAPCRAVLGHVLLPWDALGSASGLARSCRCRAALCKVQGSLAARAIAPCPALAGSPGAAEGLGEGGSDPPGLSSGASCSSVHARGWSAPCQGPRLSRVLLTLCLPQQQPLAWVLIAGAGKALIRG